MKLILAVCIMFGAAIANDPSEVVSHEANVEYNGKFHYHYETVAGSKATQDGYLKHVNKDSDGEAIEGKFSYVSDDGKEYSVAYVADENGYQARGAHLPTPPPVPYAIARALKYVEEHPYVVQNKKL